MIVPPTYARVGRDAEGRENLPPFEGPQAVSDSEGRVSAVPVHRNTIRASRQCLTLRQTFRSTAITDLLVRAGLCVLVLAPAGFLMGFGFPTGMRLVSAINTGPMPWFWGINGGAGVLAASVALVTSTAFSIDTTLMIGAACYLLVAAPAVLLVFARAAAHLDEHMQAQSCPFGAVANEGNYEFAFGARSARFIRLSCIFAGTIPAS